METESHRRPQTVAEHCSGCLRQRKEGGVGVGEGGDVPRSNAERARGGQASGARWGLQWVGDGFPKDL